MESKNYQLNDAKMFADVTDGTAIIINSLTGIYYGMNGFGTCVYENFLARSSSSEILAAIKELSQVPENVDKAFEEFISSLVEWEIIIPAETTSRIPEIDPKIAKADNYIPTCTAYQDVQELLFADPIHEVDVDEGWQPE